MTFAEALQAAALEAREARLLLAHATGTTVAGVQASPGRRLLPDEQARFVELARRRRAGEPYAYLVGRREFYGLDLAVEPAVLIPRPESELLVELALEREFDCAVDVGTGSGALALALKHARARARVIAIEASESALAVARRNAARLGLEIELRHGRFLEPLADERVPLIVANLPYVAAGDPHLDALLYEPREALVGSGVDGLGDLRSLIVQAPSHLAEGGWLLLEHGMGQEAAVNAALRAAGLEEVATWPDLAGIPRVSGGRRTRTPAGTMRPWTSNRRFTRR